MRSRKKLIRLMALFMAIQMVTSTLVPTMTYALTSGPSQPEFSSFEPVGTTNMVNNFTGDFTYNLPVLEVPGPQGSSYPISLSYHSGTTPDEEASWVGYGWTLNAGAINRAVSGIPDDFKSKEIVNHNKMPANWTATARIRGTVEAFGVTGNDAKPLAAGLSASYGIRYNNYRGLGFIAGAGFTLSKGIFNIGYSVESGSRGNFSLGVNPSQIFSKVKLKSSSKLKEIKVKADKETDGVKENAEKQLGVAFTGISGNIGSSFYGLHNYAGSTKSLDFQPYTGISVNYTAGLQVNPLPLPVGFSVDVIGSYSNQKNKSEVSSQAYGYMYSGEANDEGDIKKNMMDYHVEKGSSFNKRDSVLGVPFNDADQFIVSGEGVGGGFRLHHKSIGNFGPRFARATTITTQLGVEAQVGLSLGGGVDVGIGRSVSRLTDWNRNTGGASFSKISDEDEDEPVFFRFANDMGGNWGASIDEKPFRAGIGIGSGTYVTSDEDEPIGPLLLSANELLLSTGVFDPQINNGERSGRSSYIGFNLNKDVSNNDYSATYKAYSKRKDINLLAKKNELDLADNIGELAVFNKSGLRYIYGLPVYSRANKSLSYGVKGGTIENNDMVYFNSDHDIDRKTKIGEVRNAAYATSFLLTEITTPDYVDRALDGPTMDDFGGYTRFNYDKEYGDERWYRWRFPYNGFRYQRNSLSDVKDDLASFNGGEKEIYYLQSIETKSHIAIFYTSERVGDSFAAGLDNKAWPKEGTSSDKLKRLDKIELYALSAFDDEPDCNLERGEDGTVRIKGEKCVSPIKTVHFKYASPADELAKDAPNMADERGKLTLEKLYFEYNGKSEARISPYEFKYKYPKAATYPSKYKTTEENITLAIAELDPNIQNPEYSQFDTDAWGNYQPNGEVRHQTMQRWLDQSEIPNETFDPAAWQLKVIKLPSGGEIHVQYEADDYQYVQDKEAHVMIPLKESKSRNQVVVDHTKLGISGDEFFDLAQKIKDRYVNQQNKIYFKYLYRLEGDTEPDLSSCNEEYIDGYVDVESVEVKKIDPIDPSSKFYIFLNLGGDELPQDICQEFAKTQRLGMFNSGGGCNVGFLNSNEDKPKQVVRQLVSLLNPAKALYQETYCKKLNPELSYLRVPAPFPKRGGGLRVKRLLTYDQGLEGDEPIVYGSEFIYKTTDKFGNEISSGVATNEPQTIREENILVDLVKKKKLGWFLSIVVGENKIEQEGPIGEGIYPSASVGYSKVIIRNIHRGETNPGFSVNEYYTVKDKPLQTINTKMEEETEFAFAFGLFSSFFLKKQWATQGFSFILNDLHGKPKRMATYSGTFSDMETLNENLLISKEEFVYFEPGEKVPVKDSFYGELQMVDMGKEVDITMAQKAFEESTTNGNAEFDATANFWFAFPVKLTTVVPSLTHTEGGVATHASTKVVRYPTILKKQITYQDGIEHVTEHVAFDKYTGDVIASRSRDEFKGNYLSESVMASWEYQAMKDKASTEGRLINSEFTLEGDRLKLAADDVCDLTQFTPGDLIELEDGSQALFHVVEIDYAKESLLLMASQQNKVANVGTVSNVRIIRTGRKNALSASIGSVARHHATSDLAPININESSRYGTNDLVDDLNDEMSTRTGTSGILTLDRVYTAIDMSAYERPGYPSVDWKNATIQNVEIRFLEEDNYIEVDMIAFEVQCTGCAGGWYKVVAQEGT